MKTPLGNKIPVWILMMGMLLAALAVVGSVYGYRAGRGGEDAPSVEQKGVPVQYEQRFLEGEVKRLQSETRTIAPESQSAPSTTDLTDPQRREE